MLVMSLGYIGFVTVLHILGKVSEQAAWGAGGAAPATCTRRASGMFLEEREVKKVCRKPSK